MRQMDVWVDKKNDKAYYFLRHLTHVSKYDSYEYNKYKQWDLANEMAEVLSKTEGAAVTLRFVKNAQRILESNWGCEEPEPKPKPLTLREKQMKKARATYNAKMKKLRRQLLDLIAPTENPTEYLQVLMMNGVASFSEAQEYLNKHHTYFTSVQTSMTNAEAAAFEHQYERAEAYLANNFDMSVDAGAISELTDMAKAAAKEHQELEDGEDYDLVDEVVKRLVEYGVPTRSTELKIMLSKNFDDAAFKLLDRKFSTMDITLIQEGTEFRTKENADVFFDKREDGTHTVLLTTHLLDVNPAGTVYDVPDVEAALALFTNPDLGSYTIVQAAMGGTWYDKLTGFKVFALLDSFERLVTPIGKKVLWHIDIEESKDPYVDTVVLKSKYEDHKTGNKIKKPRKKAAVEKRVEGLQAFDESLAEWLTTVGANNPLVDNVKEILATIASVTKQESTTGRRTAKASDGDDWFDVYSNE